MTAAHLRQDPDRIALSNELHARPFPRLTAPCRAIFVAIRPDRAAERAPDADLAHLRDLIDRYGGPHPAPDARHYMGELGRFQLKWEAHTEFVTYTLFVPGVADTPFSGDSFALLPPDWLEGLGGRVVSAALVRIETAPDKAEAERMFTEGLTDCFASESLSMGWVADDEALVGTDFRLHENGLARISVIALEGLGSRRLGRVVQRVLEIESYKSFAMLTLPVARSVFDRVTAMERRLEKLTGDDEDPRASLDALTALAAEVETISTESSFRFGAAAAYEAIVQDRIEVLRMRRVEGRQLFSEFMKRRFEPAMRTCVAAEQRLTSLSDRVARAIALLSTRVQVMVEAGNQQLLESMDRRAALQLRLQQTVEGLSVVAISYYAVSLGGYLLTPLAKTMGFSKEEATAAIVLPVIGGVWLMVRRIRRVSEQARDKEGRE